MLTFISKTALPNCNAGFCHVFLSQINENPFLKSVKYDAALLYIVFTCNNIIRIVYNKKNISENVVFFLLSVFAVK